MSVIKPKCSSINSNWKNAIFRDSDRDIAISIITYLDKTKSVSDLQKLDNDEIMIILKKKCYSDAKYLNSKKVKKAYINAAKNGDFTSVKKYTEELFSNQDLQYNVYTKKLNLNQDLQCDVLFEAAYHGHYEIVKYLVDKGFKLYYDCYQYEDPLETILNGSFSFNPKKHKENMLLCTKIVKYLVKKNAVGIDKYMIIKWTKEYKNVPLEMFFTKMYLNTEYVSSKQKERYLEMFRPPRSSKSPGGFKYAKKSLKQPIKIRTYKKARSVTPVKSPNMSVRKTNNSI